MVAVSIVLWDVVQKNQGAPLRSSRLGDLGALGSFMQQVTHDSGSVGARVRPTLLCCFRLPGAVGAAGGPTVLPVEEVAVSTLASHVCV